MNHSIHIPSLTPPKDAGFRMGGNGIEVNTQYLTKDDQAWYPVVGELHFSRLAKNRWEDSLLKMKAGGIDTISTYVIWIHHEEVEGTCSFEGNLDIRHFAHLCQKHGLYMNLRPGPWVHGECRNGGLPDWILKKCKQTRTDDPTYLSYVELFYSEISKQLDGMMYHQGGPIIAIQIENELVDNPTHLLTLKTIAKKVGLIAPLYTATGWGWGDGAQLPPLELLPTFGAYPDHPWEQHMDILHPEYKYFFTHVRNDSGIGKDLLAGKTDSEGRPIAYGSPYLTCETGPGIQVTHHRRPLISPDDATALAFCKVGSGANMMGYYVYHGGSNPLGIHSGMQESKDSAYPNDLPVITYDFQAPLSETGRPTPVYYRMRTLNLFMQYFGALMAPMPSYLPDKLPDGMHDTQTLRYCVRANEKSGFIFINNHQRLFPLPEHHNVRFSISTKATNDHAPLQIPMQPLSIPQGSYFVMPYGMPLNDATLTYATAQPLCRDQDTLYFFAPKGIRCEYVFEQASIDSFKVTHGKMSYLEDTIHVAIDKPGTDCSITINTAGGHTIHLVTLTQDDAEHFFLTDDGWKLSYHHDVISENSAFSYQRAKDYSATIKEVPCSLDNKKYHNYLFCKNASLIKQYEVTLDLAAWKSLKPVLELSFTGNVAQVYANGQLISDWFYTGRPYYAPLDSILEASATVTLQILISPLVEEDVIYFDPDALPPRNVAELHSAILWTETCTTPLSF